VALLPPIEEDPEKSTKEASQNFFLYGGFIYIRRDTNQVLCVNALRPGPGLRFDGPYPWPARNTNPIADRFHKITFKGLAETGARYFAWLMPGECHDGGNSHAPISANGAFAYLFGEKDEEDSRNCYFVVQDSILPTDTELPQLESALKEGNIDTGKYGKELGLRHCG
jgi:hypothetical protein